MARRKTLPSQSNGFVPFSIDQLDAGLRILSEGEVDVRSFWDENVTTFRQTLFFAIRETSDALLSQTIPLRLRTQLETELEALVQYVELADRYIARRSLIFGRPRPGLPLPWPGLH